MSASIGVAGFSRSGSLASAESSTGYPIWFPFNIAIGGTWTGTWGLEVSLDGGSTWFNCTYGGAPSAFTGNGFTPVPNVFQKGALFRITRSAGTGTMTYQITGQGPVVGAAA